MEPINLFNGPMVESLECDKVVAAVSNKSCEHSALNTNKPKHLAKGGNVKDTGMETHNVPTLPGVDKKSARSVNETKISNKSESVNE